MNKNKGNIINHNSIITKSILIYSIIMILLSYYKPSWLYDNKTNKFKQFGCDKNQTVITLPIIGILLSILIYLIFYFNELLYNK
jgi:hypothetical protein